MSDIFANVYGARFPDVVLNSGPLPPEGGLPAPLHDRPDGKINYNSTLFGDLQPYAYGEAAYLSSQTQNNVPHRIQKILPKLYLPEPNGKDVFVLSHAVDDSDLAFVMRLNRHSVFCTGSRTSTRRTTPIGTSVDPLINLATVNYLLAGLQVGMPSQPSHESLWWELLFNMDPRYWPAPESNKRDYRTDIVEEGEYRVPEHNPFGLEDLVHFIRTCVRPFGIVRGSERQGGQNEMTDSPATWPVPAICTLVVDGKEANIVNLWHNKDVNAGDDLVLRLKLLPLKTYTLNHYFKGFARKSFEAPRNTHVWQLVPEVFEMNIQEEYHEELENLRFLYNPAGEHRDVFFRAVKETQRYNPETMEPLDMTARRLVGWSCVDRFLLPDIQNFVIPWQELGYWHIGRSQVMTSKYGAGEFYNDDLANGLKTNHMDMTFQPVFRALPRMAPSEILKNRLVNVPPRRVLANPKDAAQARGWEPQLRLERMHAAPPPPKRAAQRLSQPAPRRPAAPAAPAASRVGWYGMQESRAPEAPAASRVGWYGMQESRAPEAPAASGVAREPAAPAPASAPAPPAPAREPEAPAAASEPAAPATAGGSIIPEAFRQELLSGLAPPPEPRKAAPKGRGRKPLEREPIVEGTLLRPGAPPEACQIELL